MNISKDDAKKTIYSIIKHNPASTDYGVRSSFHRRTRESFVSYDDFAMFFDIINELESDGKIFHQRFLKMNPERCAHNEGTVVYLASDDYMKE